jgi:hypothetical protein
MAEALLHDLGLLLPPASPSPSLPTEEDEGENEDAPVYYCACKVPSASSEVDREGRKRDAKGQAILECCLRFWARAQRYVRGFVGFNLSSILNPHMCM